MTSRKRILAIGAIVIVIVVAVVIFTRPGQLVLTGIVTTNDVIVSPQISAQLTKLLVKEGDKVDANQLLAVLSPDELRADRAFAAQSEQGLGDQVHVSAALRYQEQQTADQIKQAQANVATAIAQQQEATANLDIAKLSLGRSEAMLKAGAISNQDLDQARTNSAVASARVDATTKQVESARAALALAQSAAEQIAVRRGGCSRRSAARPRRARRRRRPTCVSRIPRSARRSRGSWTWSPRVPAKS